MEKTNMTFTMDDDLLKSIIFKQAGTVLKALEEGIQNCIDAGASKIELAIDQYGFSLYDNGCGMNKEEIISCFSVFGRSSKKDDDNKIGRFGMGRGQMFAFGINTWRTKKYMMVVDAKKTIKEFEFYEGEEEIEGTKIDCAFYNHLSNYEFDNIIFGIKDYYLPTEKINFYINNELYGLTEAKVNKDYDLSDKDFDVFTSNRFYNNRIFSKGLYVKTFDSTSDYCINCKKKMELNFARNQFLDTAESTKKLNDLISKLEMVTFRKTKRFDATKALKLLQYSKSGKVDIKEFAEKKILEMCDGTMISIKSIENKTIMFSEKTRTADKAIQQGYIVLNVRQERYLEELEKAGKINVYIDNTDVGKVVPQGYYRDADLSEMVEKYGRKSIQFWFYAKLINKRVFDNERTLKIGESDNCNAWTDGYSEITLDTRLFAPQVYKESVLLKIYNVMCHEYAHEEDDTNESDHDGNFYKRYYEINRETSYKFSAVMRTTLNEIKKIYGIELSEYL